MSRAIGIDLGSYTVKVAVLEGRLGRFTTAAFHQRRVEDIPAEETPSEDDGQAAPPRSPLQDAWARGGSMEARIQALEKLLEEEGIQLVGTCAAALPAEGISARVLVLPFADRAQIARTLPFEIENHVPFDVEDMILEHRIVKSEPGRSVVLTCLVEREAVARQLASLASVGVDPRFLAIDADLHVLHTATGNQAVVDIGHSRTLVTLVVDGQTVAVRAIDQGGRDLTLRLAERFGMDWDTAEAWKHAISVSEGLGAFEVAAELSDEDSRPFRRGGSLVPPEQRRYIGVIEEGLRGLLAEVRSTLVAFEDQHEVEVDEIVLCGGTAALGGLPLFAARELGVPVRPASLPVPTDEEVRPATFALAGALAMRAAGDLRGRTIDLRKGAFAHHGNVEMLRSLAGWAAAAGVFFLLSATGTFLVNHHRLASDLQDVEAAIQGRVTSTFPTLDPKTLGDSSRAVAIMQEMTTETTTRVDTLSTIYQGKPPILEMLKDLSEGMPSHEDAPIDVRELTLSTTAINIKAETIGYEQAARIEAALKNVARFQAASKGDEKKMGEKVQFNLSIPLEGAQAEADEEKAPEKNGKPEGTNGGKATATDAEEEG